MNNNPQRRSGPATYQRLAFLILMVTVNLSVATVRVNAQLQDTGPETPELIQEQEKQLGIAVKADPDKAVEMARNLFTKHKSETAARFLLQHLYAGKSWPTLTKDQRNDFGSLIKTVYTSRPEDMRIMALYADYLIASDPSKAIPLLIKLAKVQPMRGLQAAAVCRKIGETEKANLLAKQALQTVQKMSEQDPTNTVLSLAVAQNELFLKRYAEAELTIENGIHHATTMENEARLKQAMGDTLVAWVSSLQKQPDMTDAQQLKLLKMLQRAINHAPNNPRVLTLIADRVLATIDPKDPEIKKAREELIDNASPGISHFIKGTSALMKDDVETAMKHLELAAKSLPQSGAILNNLAVTIEQRPDGDLKQALKLSNRAIQQTPNATPHFFETRGQILLRLERYEDAIVDLKKAATLPSLAAQSHKALAECYKKLQKDDLARQHLELSQKAPAPKSANAAQ